jgi:hypothetical protein
MQRTFYIALLLCFAASSAFAINRSANIELNGTVQDVVTISIYSASLTTSTSTSGVYLDIRTANAGGGTWQVTRVNCDAYLVDCRNLRVGDAIKVQATFTTLNPGMSNSPSPLKITGPIEYQ